MLVGAALISDSLPSADAAIPSTQGNVLLNVAVCLPAFAATSLYCLVTEAHVCEQLAQSCYLIATRVGIEL